jgi:hypothetical protein
MCSQMACLIYLVPIHFHLFCLHSVLSGVVQGTQMIVKLGMERQREHACTSTGYGHLNAINIPGAVRLPHSEPSRCNYPRPQEATAIVITLGILAITLLSLVGFNRLTQAWL